jgi:S-adenosylmethionine hydrolase
MKHRPIIALLTDFGKADGYVASMKGTILTIAPQSSIVDITHEVPPQDIHHAGYVLWSCYRTFPLGTIFVCVVDPGVGASRRILCVRIGGYYFLAPDNGLLRNILATEPVSEAVNVMQKKYYQKRISTTFHGRDIFAPVAAHLANGISMKKFGAITQLKQTNDVFVRINGTSEKKLSGAILHIDRFGNIITNYLAKKLPTSLKLRIGNHSIVEQSAAYATSKLGIPFMILGSTNLIEVSMKNERAAKRFGATVGQRVLLQIGNHV